MIFRTEQPGENWRAASQENAEQAMDVSKQKCIPEIQLQVRDGVFE